MITVHIARIDVGSLSRQLIFFLMQGKPVVISPEDERMHVDLFQSNGFSGFASDKVTF